MMKRTTRKLNLLKRARFTVDYSRKAKPTWHWFNCAECYTPTYEFSDPRVSLHLCSECFDKRTLGKAGAKPLQQTTSDGVWWDWWVANYELEQKKKKESGES